MFQSLQENINFVTTVATMVGSCKYVILTSNGFATIIRLYVMSCKLVAILRVKNAVVIRLHIWDAFVTLLQLNYVVTKS